MRVVYLAHKIRDPRGIWYQFQNHRTAEKIAMELWNMDLAVICPGKNTEHFDGAAPDHVWLNGDLEIVSRCDAVIMAPDWRTSRGAIDERKHAMALQIPIFEWETEREEIEEFAKEGMIHDHLRPHTQR